jgi:plastocyanin
MRFDPHHLTVRPGATVAWVNDDAVAHTVTSGHGTNPTHSPLDSPFLLRDETYAHTFPSAGVFEYLCLPHMDQAPMRGATVTVKE